MYGIRSIYLRLCVGLLFVSVACANVNAETIQFPDYGDGTANGHTRNASYSFTVDYSERRFTHISAAFQRYSVGQWRQMTGVSASLSFRDVNGVQVGTAATSNPGQVSIAWPTSAVTARVSLTGTDPYGTYSLNSASVVVYSLGGQSQTVTLSANPQTFRVGQSSILTASGGQNGYTWTNVTGGGLLADGAQAAFTASAAGAYEVQVNSPAGNGYLASNNATISLTVTAAEYAKINLPKNDSGRPIEYIFEAGGVVFGSETQNIGAPAKTISKLLPPSVPSGSSVSVYSKTVGVMQDPGTGSWSLVPGAVVTGEPVVVAPTTTPDDPAAPPPPTATAPNAPKAPDPVAGDQTGKAPWTAAPNTGALTDAAYKEGVDKQTDALAKINKTLEERMAKGTTGTIDGGGGDGDGSSDAGTHERLDAVNEKLDVMQARIQQELDIFNANPPDGGASQAGSGKSGVESAISGHGTPVFSSSGPPAQSALVITLPGGVIINLDPVSDPQALTLCLFIKDVITWIALTIYVWFAWAEFKTLCGMLTVAPQAVGNAVLGGTGGQATAVIAAVAITVFLVSFPTLYWAWNELPGTLSANPFAGATGVISGVSLYLLYLIIPVGLILTLISQAFALRKFGLVTAMGIATAIRFIVP